MKSLSRNKKAFSTLEIIVIIVLVVVVLSFLIDPNGGIPAYIKKLLGLGPIASDPYKVCYQKPDGYACNTKEIPDGSCLNGMCVFRNSVAINMDHAKLLFRTTLKQNLDKCKTDPAGCTEALIAVNNIISFVDDEDEGEVYIVINRLSVTSTEFRLNKKLGALAIFSSPHVASFMFVGDICFSDPGDKKIIGHLAEGTFIFKPENIKDEKTWQKLSAIAQGNAYGSQGEHQVCFNSVPRTQ